MAAPRAMSSEARLGAFAIGPSTIVGRVITIRILVCNSISDFRKVLSIVMGHYYRRFSRFVLRPLLSWLSPRNPQAVLTVMTVVAFGLRRYTDVKARAKSAYRRKFWRNLMRSTLTYDEYIVKDYYIVAYGLGIYLLNLLIGFLSPQADPETEGPALPTKGNDEFKPFIRRLPEFKFWYALTKAVCFAFVMTFFSIFDVPVFWPILLLYWIVLFVLTMKRQKEDRCRSRR